jgi:tetratricopeptide (TPR) repeat protein
MLPRAAIKLTLILVFVVFGIIFSSDYTEAYEVKDFERKIKLKILPEFCAYMQRGTRAGSPNGDRYKEYLGEGWRHTHHYCWGLDKMLLAFLNATVENQYRFYLSDAIEEFNYVLKRVSDHFILKPEILSKKGVALSLLGKDNEATHAFLSAIHQKPDFVFPYIQLSKLYVKNGEIEEARKVLDRALEHSPNSPLLKQALAKLHRETKKK